MPEDKLEWRRLAYAELHVGRVEDSLAHFRRGLDRDSASSAVGLALALITGGTDQDLAEACTTLEVHPGLEPAFYTVEALQALAKAPPPRDPQLRERLQALPSIRCLNEPTSLGLDEHGDPLPAVSDYQPFSEVGGDEDMIKQLFERARPPSLVPAFPVALPCP